MPTQPRPSRWPFFVLVLLGAAAVYYMKQHQEPPQQQPLQEKAVQVRVIAAQRVSFTPRIIGHGSVRPVRVWEAVAQVKGQISEKHPRLQKGALLEKDSLILGVDPTDYQLVIARTQADLAATQAQLDELAIRQQDAKASLALEEQALALTAKELERKRDLVGRGSVSASDVENEQRALLSQRQKVLSQQTTLNLIPSQKALLEAQLARHQASLDGAKRDLEHTRIPMPFTGRIAAVHVELDQYVREGEVLAVADDLALAEIEAQFPIDRFGGLLRNGGPVDVISVSQGEAAQNLGLEARVRLREQGMEASWEARFARVSDTLDPKTRTIGVIVEVEEPYSGIQPGVRPPLLKGLFVEVELRGRVRHQALVVPRHALRNDRLYLVNDANRLEIRKVEVGLLQPDYAVIESGLEEGERIIVADLIPAIEGMLLTPLMDEAAQQRLLDTLADTAAPTPAG